MIPLAFLLLAAQQPPAPAIIYTCPAYWQTIPSVGELYATKTFNADGSVREFAVRVTIRHRRNSPARLALRSTICSPGVRGSTA